MVVDFSTWLRVLAVLIWAALQYSLIIWALRDLFQRPRVRGDNKLIWALVILTLPIVGALLYTGLAPRSASPRVTRLGAALSKRNRQPPRPNSSQSTT
jgi:hypothetical protein